MFVDTHAHLNFKAFENDLDQVINQAQKNGVGKIINVGASLDSSEKAVKIAESYPNLYASVGVHPHHAEELRSRGLTPAGVKPLKQLELLAKYPKVVAIGEAGLDYHEYVSETKPGIVNKKTQEEVFLSQIELAKKLKKPIIIHSRESISTLLPLVAQLNSRFGYLSGVFHCWSENLEWAKKVVDSGFYVSFTATLTYPKNDSLREVAKYLPLDSILLETDSPFLPPVNLRGLRNTPGAVTIVGQTVANLKNISLEKVEEITTNNARNLFKIK